MKNNAQLFILSKWMPCRCDKPNYDTFSAGLFGECIYGTQQSIAFAIGWVATFVGFCCAYP